MNRHFLNISLLLFGALFALAGCGTTQDTAEDLPPIPPTMTAVPPSPPTDLEGDRLEALEDGQEVLPDDQRYSIVLPEFWVRGTAPGADVAYRESGGTPEDTGYAYNVMREQLPAGIDDAEAYAESGREAVEDTFSDVETLSMTPVQVGDAQAQRWIYTMTVTVDNVLVHQVYLVDGLTGFILTGSAPADGDNDAAIELFDAIAGSFTLPRG